MKRVAGGGADLKERVNELDEDLPAGKVAGTLFGEEEGGDGKERRWRVRSECTLADLSPSLSVCPRLAQPI